MKNQYKVLNNGVKIPQLGLGVYEISEYKIMNDVIKKSLDVGYRLFDTAQRYHNEDMLGKAIEETKIDRDNIFITSKVDTWNMGYDNTIKSFHQTLRDLRTDYLDLFLIHWPGQQKNRCLETWGALEELYSKGEIKAIGVCNCMKKHLEWFLEGCMIKPMVNQIEHHPLHYQKELIDFCKKNDIQIEAWAPLLHGKFRLDTIKTLSMKYNRTPAQIILRWNIQEGYIVIPKSIHKDRIIENSEIFDFLISDEDMEKINKMDIKKSTISRNPETDDF